MKLAIVSVFDMYNVNFGNRLQAYALNRYLRENKKQYEVTSLYFVKGFKDFLNTKKIPFLKKVKKRILRDYRKFTKQTGLCDEVSERLKRFNEFSSKNIRLPDHPYTWDDLKESDYDVIVVGSDIVWFQHEDEIKRVRFLDFKAKNPFRKIAYAASFGTDWIPEENVSDVKRCLDDFEAISVRESSSVEFLKKSIGVDGAVYAVDPTMLLTSEQWESVEKKPEDIKNDEKYIFVYLLSQSIEDRKNIERLAQKHGCRICTVPYASGTKSRADKNFGDIRVMDCSPEEWVWLIHHAEYVITDSFHGVVFSTMFGRKFLSTKRKEVFDINNRMKDYLTNIQSIDKSVALENVESLESFEWDYRTIEQRRKEMIQNSKKYIDKYL